MKVEADIRRRVSEACRVLGRLDITKAATGHVSARLPGTDRILIRARGPAELGVRYTTDDQIVEVGMDGKLAQPNNEGLEAPQEVFIHTAVYASRPDVTSVIHVHPPTVMLFSICDVPLEPLYGAYDPGSALIAIEGIPRYERSILINTPALGADLSKAMGKSCACIMRGHGITTAGASIEEAALNAIYLSELADINYRARMLGGARPISQEDQDVFRQMAARSPKKEPGKPGFREAALWRYYVALTESGGDQ
jgi:ribulose-5-phosphate 4-epimerase/fuculose-1-phosphate aldolase